MKPILLLLIWALALAACKQEKKESHADHELHQEEVSEVLEINRVVVPLSPKSGSTASGEIIFTAKNDKVTLSGTFVGLDAGTHAIHLHETADCSSEDGKSTGGHWNPTGEPHGKWGAQSGFHRGDIGNIIAEAGGSSSLSMTTDKWCLGCDDESKNIIGKAIIVHAGEDDFTTQPTGNAGGRVSCGGVIK